MTADGIRDATMSGADFLDVIDHEDRAKPNGAAPPLPVFMSADDFIAGYQPHRPLIKAWDLKRGWFYSFTAPTGGAKTAIALCEAIELAQQGARVVFMAGENPDDVRTRVILMQAKLGLERLPATLRFVDRTFNLADNLEHVRHQVELMSGADMIAIDTSPAFQVASGGVDENNNPEAIRWAQRLRELGAGSLPSDQAPAVHRGLLAPRRRWLPRRDRRQLRQLVLQRDRGRQVF